MCFCTGHKLYNLAIFVIIISTIGQTTFAYPSVNSLSLGNPVKSVQNQLEVTSELNDAKQNGDGSERKTRHIPIIGGGGFGGFAGGFGGISPPIYSTPIVHSVPVISHVPVITSVPVIHSIPTYGVGYGGYSGYGDYGGYGGYDGYGDYGGGYGGHGDPGLIGGIGGIGGVGFGKFKVKGFAIGGGFIG